MKSFGFFLQSIGFALSMFLTVALPKLAIAQPGALCRDLFTEYRGRFAGLEKPLSAPQFKAPAKIVLTRYGGHQNFHSTTSFSWTFNGKTFTPGEKVGTTYQIGFSDHESILAEQQDFSLGKMVETDYLTPQQAEMFRKLGTNLEPGQIHFFEVVHEATPAEIAQFYAKFPSTRVGGIHTEDFSHEYNRSIKTAAMWTVAGQVWNKQTGIKNKPLAWEKEEARRGQELDRTKYKYVWEWGRAAQDVSGEIAPLYAANAMMNYIQLRAYGGKVEDAYVMVHSFDKVNTRLYSRMHPNTIYPAGWDNPNDTLFLVPLKEALEKYRPSTVSEHVATIMELSEGKIGDIQALDLLIDHRENRWQELDYRVGAMIQNSPILLSDVSVGRAYWMWIELSKFGLTHESQQKILDYLGGILPALHSSNFENKYLNAADSLMTGFHYQKWNALEISNLDPEIARQDPNYVGGVLVSSFAEYMTRAAAVIQKSSNLSTVEAYKRAAEMIGGLKINFGITTRSPLIASQLEALHPGKILTQPGTIMENGRQPSEHDIEIRPYIYGESKIYLFSYEQIHNLMHGNLELYHKYGSSLSPGIWQSQYLQTQADMF